MTAQASSGRLGVVLSTVTAGPPQEFVDIGRLAEQHGFEAVYVNEGRGDALACAQAIASGTSQLTVGTNIANIYFRHPFWPPLPGYFGGSASDIRDHYRTHIHGIIHAMWDIEVPIVLNLSS